MAREAALQVLFAADVSRKLTADLASQNFEDVQHSFSLPGKARTRAHELVVGVSDHLERIDERIASSSANWKVSRLATVDRNILRLATYELMFEPETPTEVILDEAIEITRRFAGETSRAFVNGVLDLIAREVRGAAA